MQFDNIPSMSSATQMQPLDSASNIEDNIFQLKNKMVDITLR